MIYRFKKFYNSWRYYLLTSEDYKVSLEEDFQSNLFAISLTAIWFAIFAAISAVANVIIFGFWHGVTVFSVACCISTVLAIFTWNMNEKSKKGVHTKKFVIYVLSLFLFAMMMAIAVYFDTMLLSESATTYFLLFIVAGLFLINFSPQFTLFTALISTAIFILAIILFKDPSTWASDIANISMFVPAAITFNWFMCLHKMNASYKKVNLEKIISSRTKSLQDSKIELQQAYGAIVMGLSLLSESRDNITGAHIARIRKQTKLLTDEITKKHPSLLSDKMAEHIVFYSTLHDIGKVGIPDNILNKKSTLTNEEFIQMKWHTVNGAHLLSQIIEFLPEGPSYLSIALEIAESHHERYDGTGYPYGLAGEEIPFSARIVAIADIYDALRSNRPYKKGFTHEEAYDIITKGDGRTEPAHFDPIVLEAFKKVHLSMEKTYDDNAEVW